MWSNSPWQTFGTLLKGKPVREINFITDSWKSVLQIVHYIYVEVLLHKSANTLGYIQGLKGQSWNHLKTNYHHRSFSSAPGLGKYWEIQESKTFHNACTSNYIIFVTSCLSLSLSPSEEFLFCADCSGPCGQKWYCLLLCRFVLHEPSFWKRFKEERYLFAQYQFGKTQNIYSI